MLASRATPSPGGAFAAAEPAVFCMEWNAENQLKRVLKNAVEQTRFAYDPLDRRVERVAGGTTSLWTYDGQDILREAVAGSAMKYVHGPSIDEPLAQEDGAGVLSHIHADGLGSVIRTTGAAGAVISSRQYDAFGNLEGGATNGYGFTSREWDAAAGLAHYRARYYDARNGRFVSEDPLGFHAGINYYAYVDSRPTTLTDPSGMLAYLRCETIPPGNYFGWKGLGLWVTGAKHCWIEVECAGRWQRTYELQGPGRSGNPRGLPSRGLPNFPNAARSQGTTAAVIRNCNQRGPTCASDCSFENEIERQYQSASESRPTYFEGGPNSNTFVARIIRNSGGAVSFPAGALPSSINNATGICP